MSDRPRDDDWWLASDGKWYPPELAPDAGVGTDAPRPRGVVSRGLTTAVWVALATTSAIMAAASFYGLQLAPLVRSGEVDLRTVDETATGAEVAYGAWTVLAILAFIVTGVMVVIWTFRTSKAFDARGPEGRRWGGAWVIWAWVIPLANLVLPKLVINEIEKIAQIPYVDAPIGIGWRQETRTQLGDLWWALWLTGVLLAQVSSIVGSGTTVSAEALGTSVFINAVALMILAVAGAILALVVRRVEISSRR